MSKSITNQRLVYKIHSDRFRYNNWDLKLDFEEAIKNEELVSLGDSIVLRMIRRLNGNLDFDEKVNKLKEKKKKEKDKQKKKEYSKQINNESFEKDYIIIVFDSTQDWKYATNKKNEVKLNNRRFKRLIGTSGGIKNNCVVFVSEDIHSQLDKQMNNGRDLSVKYVPAKFEAYKALACSCSTEVTQPKKMLVIKDGSHIIKDNVLKLSDNGEGGFNLHKVDNCELEVNYTDGCGMIRPTLAKQWAIDLGAYHIDENGNKVEDYIPSGFNLRGFSIKGMVGTFPFEEVITNEFEGDENKYFVEDIWGDKVDIRTVDLIITDNMLKLWNGYSSYNQFIKCCEENDFKICVTKMLPKELENVRNMNYQFLQSYELSDEDIEELIKPTIDYIKGAIGLVNGDEVDYGKMLLFLKGNKINKEDFKYEEYDCIKALMIDKRLMKDPFIKQKIYKMIKKKIEDVIQVHGNYSIIFGDLYALCQHMCGLEVTGLLNKGEYYSKYWRDRNVKQVVAFRAPMTIHNNIVKMNFDYKNKEIENKIEYYYRYMNTCIVFNIWGTQMDALNGAD